MKVEKRIQALIDMGVYDLWVEQIVLQGSSQYKIRMAVDSKRLTSQSSDGGRCEIIDRAFCWASSKQGYGFWRNISRKMYDMGF